LLIRRQGLIEHLLAGVNHDDRAAFLATLGALGFDGVL